MQQKRRRGGKQVATPSFAGPSLRSCAAALGNDRVASIFWSVMHATACHPHNVPMSSDPSLRGSRSLLMIAKPTHDAEAYWYDALP